MSGELYLVELSYIRCYFYGRFWVASKLGIGGNVRAQKSFECCYSEVYWVLGPQELETRY